MTYQELAKEIMLIINRLHQTNSMMYDVYDSVRCAVKKYGVTPDEIILGTADIDYRKVVLQILIDLRYARGTDYDFEIELYRCDTDALQEITHFLEKETTEFNREGSTLIDISCLNMQEYLELIKQLELK
ncbi:MAG: hypothetical protein E7260_02945 [Lachnospiraceae bacterium]|nr:hypothetical protein [Lachnospiraceae bacterium]